MWKKKEEGGFKPLWVKCSCGKWNAVQTGAVTKYLDKILTNAGVEPQKRVPVATAEKSDE